MTNLADEEQLTLSVGFNLYLEGTLSIAISTFWLSAQLEKQGTWEFDSILATANGSCTDTPSRKQVEWNESAKIFVGTGTDSFSSDSTATEAAMKR